MFSFQFTDTSAAGAPGLIWLALAVTFGIRRPGGALLAGFAFAGGTAVFHWISSWSFLSGGDVQALITSIYFVPILSGLGAIQLAQEPDGILSLAGQQKLRKKREKARLARIAEAEAEAHGGEVPEHERHASHRRGGRAHRDTHRAELSDADVAEAAFAVRGVVAGYGDAEVLHGVDLRVDRGKVTALLGANGAGKSTLCAVAAGHGRRLGRRGVPRRRGDHRRRSRSGAPATASCSCPRRAASSPASPSRRTSPCSCATRSSARTPTSGSRSCGERRKQVAGLLSGGEQQMLSLAPALADPPVVLIADEPTLGLAPLAAEAVMDAILELRDPRVRGPPRRGAGAERARRRRHARVHGARQHRVDRARATRPTCTCSPARTSAGAPDHRRC